MDWWTRLRAEAVADERGDHDLLYHVGLRPPVPPEYVVPHLVAVTFRLGEHARGHHVYATCIDAAAALRLGARFHLDEAESLAMVDSHERVHVALQLEGVDPEAEEDHARAVDAAWLSLRHPKAAARMDSTASGVVVRVERDFLERLLDEG